MNEICVLSGKGGTGKTSLCAAFATLGQPVAVADCDVDAANLYLVLQPTNQREEKFITGHKAVIDYNICSSCGLCIHYCRFDAMAIFDGKVIITETSCDGCKLCSRICPFGAIEMVPSNKSRWYSGTFRKGVMVHARLSPGEENSGKLVNVVREQVREAAKEKGMEIILIDGPPGTGCPVISSVTGVHKAVVVAEPTRSGFHDMKRILQLIANFKIQSFVIINKWDLNKTISQEIKNWCLEEKIPVVGEIPFDERIVEAMLHCQSIVEWAPDAAISRSIRQSWEKINL